eukprot:scaffold453860_cov14-Prasinocladus_malaysianus.AAC.1
MCNSSAPLSGTYRVRRSALPQLMRRRNMVAICPPVTQRTVPYSNTAEHGSAGPTYGVMSCRGLHFTPHNCSD